MRNRYNAPDPHWCQVRYACRCGSCQRPIKVGEQGFYWPHSKTMYCAGLDCGRQAALDLTVARQDEEFMRAQFAGRY